MQDMLIGEYIKKRRLDLGLTQEELCEGCCAVSTLSRLMDSMLDTSARGYLGYMRENDTIVLRL